VDSEESTKKTGNQLTSTVSKHVLMRNESQSFTCHPHIYLQIFTSHACL